MRQPIFRFVLVTSLAAVALLGIWTTTPSRTAAGSISTAVIGMFPKSTNEFAYADLKSARKLPWFAQMQDQMLPKQMRDFEQFLSSAGIDPNSQVTDLAWGAIMSADGTSGQILGIALGAFDPSSTEAKFKAQKLPMIAMVIIYTPSEAAAAPATFCSFLSIPIRQRSAIVPRWKR